MVPVVLLIRQSTAHTVCAVTVQLPFGQGRLLIPLAAVRGLLDNIEPDERIYHQVDVALMLQQAIADAVG
jgi:hypothetical protein